MTQIGDHMREMYDCGHFSLVVADGCIVPHQCRCVHVLRTRGIFREHHRKPRKIGSTHGALFLGGWELAGPSTNPGCVPGDLRSCDGRVTVQCHNSLTQDKTELDTEECNRDVPLPINACGSSQWTPRDQGCRICTAPTRGLLFFFWILPFPHTLCGWDLGANKKMERTVPHLA
jgi:hypothetical protein